MKGNFGNLKRINLKKFYDDEKYSKDTANQNSESSDRQTPVGSNYEFDGSQFDLDKVIPKNFQKAEAAEIGET